MAVEQGVSTTGAVITVVIVENHDLFRKGLCALFETVPGIQVVAEFGTAAAAVPRVIELRPSVVLMDLHLPWVPGARSTYCGARAMEEIKRAWPAANIAVISSFDNEERVREALKAGARSYVSKDGNSDEVIEVVRMTARGHAVLNHEASEVVKRILPYSTNGATSFSELTPRENEQLALAAADHTDKQIAVKLDIRLKTVHNNWSTIKPKLGATTRAEAVEMARANGLRPGDEPGRDPGGPG
jgi:DNA-binding NarL/FixJ family response regulator